MPTPRTLTITVTTKDDEADVQSLDIIVSFKPAQLPQAKSYLMLLANSIVNALKQVGTLQETSQNRQGSPR